MHWEWEIVCHFRYKNIIKTVPKQLYQLDIFTQSSVYCLSQIRVLPPATMANSSSWDSTPKDVEHTVATDIATNSDTDGANDHNAGQLHFVRRGEAAPEASSSQETIAGYDAELMSDRTLLTAEEEKKLLRKIDWRLMTLCSLIFMFKNLDSQNVSDFMNIQITINNS